MFQRNLYLSSLLVRLLSAAMLCALAGCASTNLPPLPAHFNRDTFPEKEAQLWKTADKIETKIDKYVEPFDGQADIEAYLTKAKTILSSI